MRARLERRFSRLPIGRKLHFLIALTTGIALLLACAGFMAYEFAVFRTEALERATSVAEVVARNSRAAVSFHDVRAAERTLGALGAEEEVSRACILTGEGRVLATYPEAADAERECWGPPRGAAEGHVFQDRALLLTLPIRLDGESIGTLLVRYELSGAYERVLRYMAIVVVVMLGSLGIAVLIAQGLQALIARPVDRLVRVARRVSRDQDYSLRAVKSSDDELGVLIDSFNEMLDKIEGRDAALARHRETLEQQVAERTRTLATQNENLRQEIEARRRAETALRKSERDIRMLMEQASDGIAILNTQAEILAINPAGCEMLGWSPDDAVGMRLRDLLPPAEAGRTPSLREALGDGRVLLQERRLQRGDGSFLWTETSMKRLDDGRVQAIIRDVTHRKELEEQLRHAQKMEAVGQLAAGVAHEVNNPMSFVRSNLSILRKEWDGFERELVELGARTDLREGFAECSDLIDESLEGVDRVVSIVRDVKEFTHQGVHEHALVDLREVLDGVLRLAAPYFGPDVRIERDYGPAPLVSCVVDQIRQVFLNLVVNASDAVGECGLSVLRIREADPGVRITVEDDGCGVAPEIASRLFDPFFTTKPVGQGTGLGLAISYDIVRRHGGSITFESEPVRGAAFHVTLPADGDDHELSPV